MISSRTQAFVVLLFGVALVRLATSDLLLRFVRPYTRPLVLAAGLFMVALAVWSLLVDARRAARHPDGTTPVEAENAANAGDAHDGTHGHDHSVASRAAWLVLAPVVAVLVIGPPALGVFTANRQPSVVAAGRASVHYPPLTGGGTVALGMFDFAGRAVDGGGTTLTGRAVQLTGFVARGSGDDFLLARLIITCCAADASPIVVRVTGAPHATGLSANTWVRVTGRYAGVDASDPDIPVLAATSLSPIAQPADPYD